LFSRAAFGASKHAIRGAAHVAFGIKKWRVAGGLMQIVFRGELGRIQPSRKKHFLGSESACRHLAHTYNRMCGVRCCGSPAVAFLESRACRVMRTYQFLFLGSSAVRESTHGAAVAVHLCDGFLGNVFRRLVGQWAARKVVGIRFALHA
jgi:hypothetical protein